MALVELGIRWSAICVSIREQQLAIIIPTPTVFIRSRSLQLGTIPSTPFLGSQLSKDSCWSITFPSEAKVTEGGVRAAPRLLILLLSLFTTATPPPPPVKPIVLLDRGRIPKEVTRCRTEAPPAAASASSLSSLFRLDASDPLGLSGSEGTVSRYGARFCRSK